jgi:sec-independent protein translocase protein TatB
VRDAAQSVKDGVENSIAQNLAEVEQAWHDGGEPLVVATPDDLARKAREFRRKKLVRNSAVPGWYKQRHGGKTHVTSAAARVARFRPRGKSPVSFFQ